MNKRTHKCMTNGCVDWAAVWITKAGYHKHVCMSCRDEMTSIFGWKMLKWEDTK